MSKLPRRRLIHIDENRAPVAKVAVRAKSRPPSVLKKPAVKAVVPKKVPLQEQLDDFNHKNSVILQQVEERIAQLKKTYSEVYECKENRDALEMFLADIINQDVSVVSSIELTKEGILSEIDVLEGKVSEAVAELATMNRIAIEMTDALLDEEMKLRGVNKLLNSAGERHPAAQSALENLKGQLLKALESTQVDMVQLTDMCNVIATIHAKCALLNMSSITWDCHLLPCAPPPISQVALRIVPPKSEEENLSDLSIREEECPVILDPPDELTYELKVVRTSTQSGAPEAQVEVSATPLTGKLSGAPVPLSASAVKARFVRCLVPPGIDRDPRCLRATQWDKLSSTDPYVNYLKESIYLDEPYISILADQLTALVTTAIDPCDGTIKKPETLLVVHLDASDTSDICFWGSTRPRTLVNEPGPMDGVFQRIIRQCFAVAGQVEAGIIVCCPNKIEPVSAPMTTAISPPVKKNFRKSISYPDLTADFDMEQFQGEGLFSQLGNSQIDLDLSPEVEPDTTMDSPDERHVSAEDTSSSATVCTFDMRVWDSAAEFIDMAMANLNQTGDAGAHGAVLLNFNDLTVCVVHVSTVHKRDPNVTETFQQLKIIKQTLQRYNRKQGKLPTQPALSPIGRALAYISGKKSGGATTGRDGMRAVCIATLTYPETTESVADLLGDIQSVVTQE